MHIQNELSFECLKRQCTSREHIREQVRARPAVNAPIDLRSEVAVLDRIIAELLPRSNCWQTGNEKEHRAENTAQCVVISRLHHMKLLRQSREGLFSLNGIIIALQFYVTKRAGKKSEANVKCLLLSSS